MRKFLGASLCAAVLVLTGCTTSAKFVDPTAPTRDMFGAAIEDVADLDMLRYNVGVTALGNNVTSRTIEFVAFSNGTSYGTFTTKKADDSQIISHGEDVFARSTTSFWNDAGFPSGGKLKNKWVKVDPESWFNPGALLAPAYVAETLLEQFQETDALRVQLPAPAMFNGVSAYSIPTLGGHTHVAAEKPHELLGVEGVELSIADPQTRIRTTLRLDLLMTPPDAEELTELGEKLQEVSNDMETPFDLTSTVDVKTDQKSYDCHSSFTCTFVVEVEVHVYGDRSDRALVVFEATSESSTLGEETCVATKTVKTTKKVDMTCTVQFPVIPGSHEIQGLWTSNAFAILDYDADALSTAFEEAMTAAG